MAEVEFDTAARFPAAFPSVDRCPTRESGGKAAGKCPPPATPLTFPFTFPLTFPRGKVELDGVTGAGAASRRAGARPRVKMEQAFSASEDIWYPEVSGKWLGSWSRSLPSHFPVTSDSLPTHFRHLSEVSRKWRLPPLRAPITDSAWAAKMSSMTISAERTD